MKKLLLLSVLFTSVASQAQATIYETTHAATNGAEITGTANGLATSFGDVIKLAGTERLLDIISVDLFNLTDTSDFNLTMTLYTDCPTLTGISACGTGPGTLVPFSEITIPIIAPPVTGKFTVDFEYNGLDISSEADNTIVVMLKASRNNVFWVINESIVIGSGPTADAALSTLVRCGSTAANNGCNRTFTSPTINNVAMKVTANPILKTNTFVASLFTVVPNPITNVVTVSNDKNLFFNAISITDINGREVKKQLFDNVSNIQMNVADLASGMYLMKISSAEGYVIKKVVKD